MGKNTHIVIPLHELQRLMAESKAQLAKVPLDAPLHYLNQERAKHEGRMSGYIKIIIAGNSIDFSKESVEQILEDKIANLPYSKSLFWEGRAAYKDALIDIGNKFNLIKKE